MVESYLIEIDKVIDRYDNSFIIADNEKRCVVRFSPQYNQRGKIIISNIECYGLTMHGDGSLYVPDLYKNEGRIWKRGKKQGILVAGGYF